MFYYGGSSASFQCGLSWPEGAECVHSSFGKVYHAVKWIVDWDMQHQNWDEVESLGVDEVQIGK